MNKKYDKLVRDNIPQIIKESGKHCIIKKENSEQLKEYYLKKIKEEVLELENSKNNEEIIEELSDIFEVLDGMINYLNIDPLIVKNKKEEKKSKRGGFSNLILKEVISNG